jgi:hypothetical protein
VPVGTVVPWYESLTNTLVLDSNYWARCNGMPLTNASSPLNGMTIPSNQPTVTNAVWVMRIR